MNTRLFDLSFCSIPVFFLDPFTSLRERKLSLLTTGKIQRFVAPGRSKMISLQDSPCLYEWYSCLFIACVLVFFLSLLSPLSSFYVCRHIQRAIHKLKFIAFFKMNVCFCKKQLAMQVPAKRNAGCSIGFECLISHWLTRRGGRTYVRSDISDVITLPKFFACMHLLYSLTHGASLRRRSAINHLRSIMFYYKKSCKHTDF